MRWMTWLRGQQYVRGPTRQHGDNTSAAAPLRSHSWMARRDSSPHRWIPMMMHTRPAAAAATVRAASSENRSCRWKRTNGQGLRLSVRSGIEYVVSNPVRPMLIPIRTSHFETPQTDSLTVLPGRDP